MLLEQQAREFGGKCDSGLLPRFVRCTVAENVYVRVITDGSATFAVQCVRFLILAVHRQVP